MHAETQNVLVCPVCRGPLGLRGRSYACPAGHSFDVAREGYVNLLGGRPSAARADTSEMVRARTVFLGAGHFRPMTDALAAVVAEAVRDVPGCVVEVGAGTGHHLAAVLEQMPGRTGVALDLSKHAARHAARAHERILAVVSDAWGVLPLADAVAAAVVSVFAPRNAPEFSRVLVPGGTVVVVTPTPRHLNGLVEALGMLSVDERKEERLAASLGGWFERRSVTRVEAPLTLNAQEALLLVSMGPSAWHLDPAETAGRIEALGDPVRTRLSVEISVWRPV